MSLNPSFPNYANGPAGTEVIAWTVTGGQPLYRLPLAYVNTGFGAAFVCQGSTVEAPTFPEGVYAPDPYIESAGTISGTPAVGSALTFTPGAVTGTAPITVVYNWIRYNPGGTSLIVGTGLNYTVQTADLTYQLVVQTVATGLDGAIGTQTVPFGPVVPSAPIITDAGSISSVPPNPPPSSGITNFNIAAPGANYIYAIGPTRPLDISGDGIGASGFVTLNPVGNVVSISIEDSSTTVAGGSGTITYEGDGSETDLVISWVTTGPASTVVDAAPTFTGGSGWTQANLNACFAGTYGNVTFVGDSFAAGSPTVYGYVGCPILSGTVTSGGSGYTSASATVEEDPTETGFPTPATIVVVLGGAVTEPNIYPNQLAVYSGPTVTGLSPQISWIWGYGPSGSFQPFQLGGTTYRVQPSDVNKEILIQVTATNTGGSNLEYSEGIVVDDTLPAILSLPKIGPQTPYVGIRLTGEQGRFTGYPAPQVTDFGFAEFLLPTPTPIPSANKVYTYLVPPGSEGKRFVFYVTAANTAGSTTAYSTPTDSTWTTLAVVEPPVLTGFQSPAQYNDRLKGTPAIFNISASVANYFAYQNNDGSYTQIAGTVGSTTYVLGMVDIGKSIVYVSEATAAGPFGTQTAKSYSNATGTVRRFAKVTSPPTITWSNIGPAPLIGATATLNYPSLNPTIVYPNATSSNPTIVELRVFGYYPDGTSNYLFGKFNSFSEGSTFFTVPDYAYGQRLGIKFVFTYNDGTGPVTQTLEYNNLTPPVVGTPPQQLTPGVLSPSNVYNPGNTLTYAAGTYSGIPAPRVTWTWRRVMGTDSVLLKNGGTTYTLPNDSSGWQIYVEETATNVVTSVVNQTPVQTIGGPIPAFTRLPLITGDGKMTVAIDAILYGTFGLAVDPITGQSLAVTNRWMIQYPGQTPQELPDPAPSPSDYSFINQNGKWTGAQVYLQCSASNTVGTSTVESNRVTLVGTPRIVSGGRLGAQVLPNIFRLTACAFDGGGQPTTTEWSAAVQTASGVPLASIFTPATQASGNPGTGTGRGVETIKNTQGATNYTFPEISVTFV